MLVLKLRRDQSAKIGPHVTITVLRELDDAWLVIGIDAPPEWRISREASEDVSATGENTGVTTEA